MAAIKAAPKLVRSFFQAPQSVAYIIDWCVTGYRRWVALRKQKSTFGDVPALPQNHAVRLPSRRNPASYAGQFCALKVFFRIW